MLPRFDLAAILVPHTLAPITLDIDRALVERWWAGLGRPADTPAPTVPPFAFTGGTILLLASHFDITGGVYWREQVTYHRPATVGDRVTISGGVDATYVHDGRLYAVMSSQTEARDGGLIASSRSTGLQQYRRGSVATSPGGAPPPGPPGPDHLRAAENPSLAALRSLTDGQEFTGPVTEVTLEMMRALAGEDDRNPIHTDEEVAQRAGLRAPIAGGPHVLALVLATLLDTLGPEALSWGTHVDVKWVSPVYSGDRVTPAARVQTRNPRLVVFDVSADVEGRLAMAGTVTVPLGRAS